MTKPDYKGHKNLAEMIKGHIENWRDALKNERAKYSTVCDESNVSYVDHELKALEEIEKACELELGL